jgi:hypothetical protein
VIGTSQLTPWLSQAPPWQAVASRQRTASIEQYQIEISMKASMLKSIIDQQ